MKYVIIGSGVAGLCAAYKLLEKRHEVIILEKESDIGGLSRGFRYGDFHFDIGPHRFFTDSHKVYQFILSVLQRDYLVIKRRSSIYLLNKYFSWPLGPSVLAKFPANLSLRIISDAFSSLRIEGEDFKSAITNRYGKTLFELVFKDYTEKFCCFPADELHRNWAQASLEKAVIDKRIKIDSLLALSKMIYKSIGLRTVFLYPKGGCCSFARRLEKMINDKGGKIFKNVGNVSISFDKNKITSLQYTGANADAIELDYLIYTGPLPSLAEQLSLEVPKLEYLNSVICNMEIKRPLNNSNQWIYFGEKGISFTRISFPGNFDEKNVPPGRDSLCVEATCKNDSFLWENPESVKNRFIEDLSKVNLCQRRDIEGMHFERVAHTYPIYKLNYLKELSKIKAELNEFHNLTCLGRTGEFWYNNMDESINAALELADSV